jgi:uncharacterized protein DUF262
MVGDYPAPALEEISDEELFASDAQEAAEPEPYPETPAGTEREIFTTPIDPDVQTLLSQIEDRSLILNPEFQRARVWDRARQSRLIESLLLNIPIPPCFFAEDPDETRVVVDGQQRLRAIYEFTRSQYALTGLQVRSDLNGDRWEDLGPRDARKIHRRVMRTIVITEHSDPDIRFEIFQRLNTGGVPLTSQEIRNAIYRGTLNQLLDHLVRDQTFLDVLGRAEPDKRLRHHELVLRFFAVDAALENFRPPLKKLLNTYMDDHRNPTELEQQALTRRFARAVGAANTVFQPNTFRRFRRSAQGEEGYETVVSRAVFDLQMVSLYEFEPAVLVERRLDIVSAFERLSTENQEFIEALSRATDHRSRFYLRMRLWGDALRGLGLEPPFAQRLPPTD